MPTIDLNSDLGESFGQWCMGDDAAMLDIVTSANVACGFHAGDPAGILRTLRAAAAKGVTIGAHVAYPDLVGFGRRVRPGGRARHPGEEPDAQPDGDDKNDDDETNFKNFHHGPVFSGGTLYPNPRGRVREIRRRLKPN